MIRFKDKILEDYSIDPVTAIITDQNGIVQKTGMHHGRPVFKGIPVHQIMAHTFFGYKSGCDVHHLDENKLNNSLNNLVYLTHSEHARLHSGELLHDETREKLAAAHKGKPKSAETKVKISEGLKGKPKSKEHKEKLSVAFKGKPLSEEHKEKLSASMKGKNKGRVKWVKAGEANYKLSKECPGEGWTKTT